MDTRKLDKWAELLLDTGKRNNLINFKDTRLSSAEILLPASDVLFEKADSDTVFEIYDPMLTEEEDGEDAFPDSVTESPAEEDDKTAYLHTYAPKLRRKNQMLVYSTGGDPMKALKTIDKKAREFIEETGVNVAYLAFGFIHWKEDPEEEAVFRAPLLLVPIRLEKESSLDPYTLEIAEGDCILNPTFAYKLEAEYGIHLPEYDDEGLTAYLDTVRALVAKLRWRVTSDCRIGIFSFLKINMYRDLKDNAQEILQNPNVRRLLGEPMAEEASLPSCHLENPLISLHSVVDADSSQMEAIELAKAGRSFVLQGPPGTGKSQTITNLIAEFLSDGKKVLFVSEKLAALNVVYSKLGRAGLSEFCLELHSHKANKKEIIDELCRILRKGRSTVSARADTEIAIKEQAQKKLDAYAEELHRQRPVIGRSLYQLFEEDSALRDAPAVDVPIPSLTSKGSDYLTETLPLVEEFGEYLPSVGYRYRENPWYGCILPSASYQDKTALKAALSAVQKRGCTLSPLGAELSRTWGISCRSAKEARIWERFFRFVSQSKLVTPAMLDREQFERAQAALSSFSTRSAEILSLRAGVEEAYDADIWKLDGRQTAKLLTKQYTGTFSRLFSGEYRGILKSLRLCRKDGRKPDYREAVRITKALAACEEKTAAYLAEEAPVKALFGEAYTGISSDFAALLAEAETFGALLSVLPPAGNLRTLPDFSAVRPAFAAFADRLAAAFAASGEEADSVMASAFEQTVFSAEEAETDAVSARCEACLAAFDALDNWCHFHTLLAQLAEKEALAFLDAAIAAETDPGNFAKAFRKQFVFQWIDAILSSTPVLSGFSRIAQEKTIRTFSEKDTEQFEINKARIRAELSADRPSLDMIAPGSALAVLLREGEKKRRQKSIRTLLSEAGELIQRIKPCFLMSPLSVSTFLTADTVHFDVVIFDEASQIFPQDAIGAIYRAKQLIVVGDSRQMPPSNFFNTTTETGDDDEETGDVTDFESILDLCSTSMQQCRLSWHYRSRFEELIAFSNKNFYDNALVTFPSAKADTVGTGVDYYFADGIFDRKSHTNRVEAEFVVDLIYQNIEKYPDRSLGVVAFSVAQQELIEKLLDRRRQSMPDAEFFFRSDAEEPFFVKNLETVQGDERDTIIFSVAYGYDEQGKLLHNFGPLNRVGGERRLNVAVTRAKYNVQLVSSMHYTDIDLKRTSADGARLLREYLDFAENGTAALSRTLTVGASDPYDSDFEAEVCTFLRSRGYHVDTQIGCSGFRIDLGLKPAENADYVLAVECDGASYHASKNARDRDRLRQQNLERMGWRFYRVWSTDWFCNPAAEKERLLAAAEEALRAPAETETPPPAEPPKESFEQAAEIPHFAFPAYRAADFDALGAQYLPDDLQGMVHAVLTVEAPLSEDLFLKRVISCYDREKVTSAVERAFNEQMEGCRNRGILRRNGFLYLLGGGAMQFRRPGDITRDISQIAPEELAAGMLEILRQNITADKAGLYRSLAQQCGVSRVGKAVSDSFDAALQVLAPVTEIDGDQVIFRG